MSDDPASPPASAAPSTAVPVIAPQSAEQPHRATLRDWLELARISNLPTVWTNVMVGAACGIAAKIDRWNEWGRPTDVSETPIDVLAAWAAIIAFAMSCFYIGGMILNDWMDLAVDRVERPRRPLPSGRIHPRTALAAACFLFVFGLAVLWLLHGGFGLRLGLILVAAIAAYDATHKKSPLAVLLMGACRGLVYTVPALLIAVCGTDLSWNHPKILIPAAVITAYTVCITIVSRSEVSNALDLRKYLAVLMPVGVLAMVGVLKPAKMEWWIAIAAFAVALWLARAVKFVFAKPPKTVPAILTWLSGMCLIDAYFLTLLGYPVAALIAGGCFALTAWGHRRILGT